MHAGISRFLERNKSSGNPVETAERCRKIPDGNNESAHLQSNKVKYICAIYSFDSWRFDSSKLLKEISKQWKKKLIE